MFADVRVGLLKTIQCWTSKSWGAFVIETMKNVMIKPGIFKEKWFCFLRTHSSCIHDHKTLFGGNYLCVYKTAAGTFLPSLPGIVWKPRQWPWLGQNHTNKYVIPVLLTCGKILLQASSGASSKFRFFFRSLSIEKHLIFKFAGNALENRMLHHTLRDYMILVSSLRYTETYLYYEDF